MSNQIILYWSITGLVFACVGLLSFGGATYVLRRGRLRQRFAATGTGGSIIGAAPGSFGRTIQAKLEPGKIGVDAGEQRRLRAELIKAGFFSQDAVAIFTVVRLAIVILFPFILYLALANALSQWGALEKFGVLAGAFTLAYYLPKAYIDRRQRILQERYRLAFPDFLDLLVVCVDAGLSLEAALERVTTEIGAKQPELRANLALMAGETRAGRGTIEALHGLADRLNLDEARSLATLLQQSLELGTDISQALTTYSEEMRDKRMSRAEQKAYALPVKLVLPLGIFIFPVIMIVIMTPVIIRLARVAAMF
ncbi:type II secretion system F family protein [Microvirga sp. G4-2]|uniref:type II secretion system F family protein n=1 Tax=Microvirga sp. G4-2 TaxID=3434467 RepID=UPI004044462F